METVFSSSLMGEHLACMQINLTLTNGKPELGLNYLFMNFIDTRESLVTL